MRRPTWAAAPGAGVEPKRTVQGETGWGRGEAERGQDAALEDGVGRGPRGREEEAVRTGP